MLWCNSKSVVLTFNIFIFPPAAGSAVFLCAGCGEGGGRVGAGCARRSANKGRRLLIGKLPCGAGANAGWRLADGLLKCPC